jgi:hypothetical protein
MSELTVDHPSEHPVQLTVEDDLRRNRLTVAFRIFLLIPHVVWIVLWSIAVFFAAIANWVATLVQGVPPTALHRFMCAYIRYRTHLGAYAGLVASPYPGFVGEEGEYPVDVRLPGPEPQERWKVFLRLLLALPALLVASTLGGGSLSVPGFGRGRGSNRFDDAGGVGLLGIVTAVLGWFASLARGRMPQGLRDAGAYSVGYGAQTLAYLLLVTERYPNADPTALLADVPRPPQHPVHLVGDAHDLRQSRVMVFFRLPLAIPHVIWLTLWTIPAVIVSLLNWFVTLVTGTPAASFHRFLSAWIRYSLHVYAFLFLVANPFPGFLGEPGRYPLDLVLPPPQRQSRWVTAFRIVLAIPAYCVNLALQFCLYAAAFLTWFYALATGRAPWGLRNLSAYALRYGGQYNAYLYLITDRYPHASPLEGSDAPAEVAVEEAAAA